jgi:hypothetical protein
VPSRCLCLVSLVRRPCRRRPCRDDCCVVSTRWLMVFACGASNMYQHHHLRFLVGRRRRRCVLRRLDPMATEAADSGRSKHAPLCPEPPYAAAPRLARDSATDSATGTRSDSATGTRSARHNHARPPGEEPGT